MIVKNKQSLTILLFLLWQLFSVYLMVVGVWTSSVAWVNVGLIILFIVYAPAFEGLLLVVASMAFYIVLPQQYSDTLSMWRPVVGVLFLKALMTSGVPHLSRGWPWPPAVEFGRLKLAPTVKKYWSTLSMYEKIAIVMFAFAVLSLTLAQYPLRGAAQLVFLLNTALVYPIVIWTVKSKEQFIRLLKAGAVSTGIIIAIGYVQFAATLFSTAYYFWQYWALRVASLYYGLSIAKVLQYSNSWVTVSGEEKTLRMFSIMTSSHGFAMVCVFFLAFALPLVYMSFSRRSSTLRSLRLGERESTSSQTTGTTKVSAGMPTMDPRLREDGNRGNWWWIGVVLACLALILSGTRGVWAGMIPALFLVGVLYYGKWFKVGFRTLVAPIFVAMLLVVVLFEVSPVLDRGFTWVRHAGGESTLDRLGSIVDPNETSNAGRLEMWKAASKYALHHPFGVGYANFVVTLSGGKNVSFEEAASQENTLYNLPQRYITAHSLYLQLLVELSMVGLLLFGLFWLLFFHETWKYLLARVQQTSPETIFIASSAIIFVWFLAYSVFDLTWLNDKILLYTFLALGLARIALKDSQQNE